MIKCPSIKTIKIIYGGQVWNLFLLIQDLNKLNFDTEVENAKVWSVDVQDIYKAVINSMVSACTNSIKCGKHLSNVQCLLLFLPVIYYFASIEVLQCSSNMLKLKIAICVFVLGLKGGKVVNICIVNIKTFGLNNVNGPLELSPGLGCRYIIYHWHLLCQKNLNFNLY